jgi:hypothetical protein
MKRSILLCVLMTAFVLSCAGTKDVGGGLWGLLGGGSKVSALVHSFSAHLAKDAAASKALGAAGIESAKYGLYNSIAKSGGYGIEKGSDLLGALKGKNLDTAAVDGIGKSLSAAGKEQDYRADQMAALMELWEPVAKKLK